MEMELALKVVFYDVTGNPGPDDILEQNGAMAKKPVVAKIYDPSFFPKDHTIGPWIRIDTDEGRGLTEFLGRPPHPVCEEFDPCRMNCLARMSTLGTIPGSLLAANLLRTRFSSVPGASAVYPGHLMILNADIKRTHAKMVDDYSSLHDHGLVEEITVLLSASTDANKSQNLWKQLASLQAVGTFVTAAEVDEKAYSASGDAD